MQADLSSLTCTKLPVGNTCFPTCRQRCGESQRDWVSSTKKPKKIGYLLLQPGSVRWSCAEVRSEELTPSELSPEEPLRYGMCFHSRLIRNHKIKHRLYVRQTWAVSKLNLNMKVFLIFCLNRRTIFVLIIET